MSNTNLPIDDLVHELLERSKELNCLFTIEETLNNSEIPVFKAINSILLSIPAGWQYPMITEVKITLGEDEYKTPNFGETPWALCSEIRVQEKRIGNICVHYTKEMPPYDEGPFLKEERRLINTIADRIGHFIFHNKMKAVFENLDKAQKTEANSQRGSWKLVLEMIRRTDPTLFMSILRKLLYQLCWNGIDEADKLLKRSVIEQISGENITPEDENKPLRKRKINTYDDYIEAIIKLTDEYIKDEEILLKVQKWIQEDKSSALIKVVETQGTSLADIGDAIRKYYHIAPEKFELSPSTVKGLRVSLLRRFFTDDLDFIRIAKEYVKLTDFYSLIDKMIFPPSSHGKLGGKSSGLFLASNILKNDVDNSELLNDVKIPKTWYMTSDGVLAFMHYNNLEEALEQKYKEIDEVRLEYPHIVQVFKNAKFPPDLEKGLSVALDDFGDKPLVVRSSSLLEDQMGAAFSGKYKSLFLANRGTKQERLLALTDAVAEVYASTFGPDPIEYRAERGLLDFHEEMGIMIQEVVGNKIGNYFLPTFAGVAFSNNEFRWSSRIKREDGLVRIVPGLGTRAVDRVSDDYPLLIAPGLPNLKVNVTIQEMIRYSPKKIDVINLDTNDFETIRIEKLLKKYGDEWKGIQNVVSVLDGSMQRPVSFNTDFGNDELIVTFDGLISNTNFVKKLETILKTLEDKLKTPVDLEFASDGEDFYLLQCRPQSRTKDSAADPIPKDVPEDKLIFSANRFVSNGRVPDVTHIVYVDPIKYGELGDKESLQQVGRAVGKLNKTLPKRGFILMGPGRWGSRGDIKLGVNVTYSDINNTSMLIEIAKQKGNYVPDLSFGTHFFQDLVEANIRYLPLYPDDEGIKFNDRFFSITENILSEVAPDFAHLADTVKVIDVQEATKGLVLKVHTNADLDEAVAVLSPPSVNSPQDVLEETETVYEERPASDHWRWRFKMAEKIAKSIDTKKYGVKGVYVFGSTKNASAGSGSDIDLLVHILDSKESLEKLQIWFDGWSRCLSEMNYLRTGYKTQGLLDVHYVTDEDLRNRTSYAVKIGAVTDAARPLKIDKTIKG